MNGIDQAAAAGEALGGAAVIAGAGVAVHRSGHKWLTRRFTRFQRDEKLDLILHALTPNGGSSVLDHLVKTYEEVMNLRGDVQTEWQESSAVHATLQRQIDDLREALHDATEAMAKAHGGGL